MSGELHFLDLNGVEIANARRTIAYLRRGLGSVQHWAPDEYPCAVLDREIGGSAPFVSPSADPAPWYDAATAESAEFLGMIARLDFQTLTVQRGVSQRFSGIGGGVIGAEQVAARAVKVDAMLVASSCAGLEYGRHWIYSHLGADCAGCALGTLRVRESCPPDNGLNDTRGERIIYDAALIGGIERTDREGDQSCNYDGLGFTLAGQSPYLFSRPTATSAPVAIGDSAGAAPPPPAVIDNFTRANEGPPPSASWTGAPLFGYGNTLRVLGNVLDNSNHTPGTIGGAYWNAANYGPDVAVSAVVPTRVNSGRFELLARLTTPGSTGSAVFCEVIFGAGAGQDSVYIGRRIEDGSMSWNLASATGTYANGDTFMLTCRGDLIEAWRKPSGGAWTRLVAGRDDRPGVAARVGVAILEQGATQTLDDFAAATLTNGSLVPRSTLTIPLSAQSIGILSPIITLASTGEYNKAGTTKDTASGIRVQIKPQDAGECYQSDAFGADDLASRWTGFPNPAATDFQIVGGKLKPKVTGYSGGLARRVYRRDANGAAIQWPGGRVEATIKTGASVVDGAWGVAFGLNIGAYLVKTSSAGSNFFAITNAPNGVIDDFASVTPLTGTTYRIIFQLDPLDDGTFTATAWIVDVASAALLTRPLTANVGALNALGPLFYPAISTAPADTGEEWDSFLAIENTPNQAYIEGVFPKGTLIIDASRRVSQFTPQGAIVTENGASRIWTPMGVPIGWPDLCAGAGEACLQVEASSVATPGTTFAYALQHRVR